MRAFLLALVAAALLGGCSRKEEGPASAPTLPRPAEAPPASPAPGGIRVTWTDPEDRPVREARLVNLPVSAFDAQGKFRADAVASALERIRVRVEDAGPGAPGSVTLRVGPSDPPRVIPLTGPPGSRVSPWFLLSGDSDDVAAAGEALILCRVGWTLEIRYRDAVASLKVGPSAVHEIPVRFIAVGSGLASTPEIERGVDLRLARANAVWEPFGRRFKRGPIVRLDALRGVFLIRGRAAGADNHGRPSRCGIVLDGKDVAVPAAWRTDGAPMTPKATARALTEQIGKSYQVDLFDNLLAGDREALVVRVRRRDGVPARVEPLAAGNDISQAVTPVAIDPGSGIEASQSTTTLTLDEVALLASGRETPRDGIDVYIVSELGALQARRAIKVYPDADFPASLAGVAVLSWAVLDGSGRFPYALARAVGELLLPAGWRPGSQDTLFAEPLSESPGASAHKRITAATGQKIAERGRGLAAKNVDKK
jgi:hypothetical protein